MNCAYSSCLESNALWELYFLKCIVCEGNVKNKIFAVSYSREVDRRPYDTVYYNERIVRATTVKNFFFSTESTLS